MTDEKKRDEDDGEALGPGQTYYNTVGKMESFYDRMKLLKYDKEFMKEFRRKPLNRLYFAIPSKSDGQFFTFATLAAWLIRKTGGQFDAPQEEDDPNSIISNILDSLRHLGTSIDFPPSKLKQGYGEQVVFVLDRLIEECMKRAGFVYKKQTHRPTEDLDEEEMMPEDDAEVNLAKIEEEMFNDYQINADEDEPIISVDELKNRSRNKSAQEERTAVSDQDHHQLTLQPFVDPTEWKLEVERVTPQLKVTIRSDTKDWRNHLEQMHQYRESIGDNLSSTQSQLQRIQDDIAKSLDKIGSRERYLNSQLGNGLGELKTTQERLGSVKQEYSQVSGGVMERQMRLTQITDELEAIKQEMEERGSNMSDGTPVVNIKKVLSKMKSEIAAMEVRRGVVEHMLMQSRIRDRQLHVRAAGHNSIPR